MKKTIVYLFFPIKTYFFRINGWVPKIFWIFFSSKVSDIYGKVLSYAKVQNQ